jgi:hypothetical protein
MGAHRRPGVADLARVGPRLTEQAGGRCDPALGRKSLGQDCKPTSGPTTCPVPSQFRQSMKRHRNWRETVGDETAGQPAFRGVLPGCGKRGDRTRPTDRQGVLRQGQPPSSPAMAPGRNRRRRAGSAAAGVRSASFRGPLRAGVSPRPRTASSSASAGRAASEG